MPCLRFLLACAASLSLCAQNGVFAQNANAREALVETCWRYAYAHRPGTNSLVHQADDAFRHFLFFRYDDSCRQWLNGRESASAWQLRGDTLLCPIRDNACVQLLRVNRFVLELAGKSPGGSVVVYHFVRATRAETPFDPAADELPEVLVESRGPRPGPNSPGAGGDEAFINIELVGGGYYGGIDPVQHDYISINSEGRLIREFESAQNGRLVQKRSIPRAELVRLADWIAEQGFFNFENRYDCTAPDCEHRKTQTPMPVPLRLSVAYGGAQKMVSISIWGRDRTGVRYVDYPPAMDGIVDAIQRMANERETERKR